jgi:hypothetical protein
MYNKKKTSYESVKKTGLKGSEKPYKLIPDTVPG